MQHTMKGVRSILPIAALLLGLVEGASAQTATSTVTYEVTAINEISLSSSTVSLTVNAATAGSAPTAATVAQTWAVTTNQTAAKVTGAINTAMPSGLTLSVTLGNPASATSAGKKALTAIAVDLVTGITKLNESGLSLDWELGATAAAGVVASANKTATFTITGGI
ncbi:MAG: hypothetical protein V3T24_01880 [Longimicrobiales bacterium]